MRAQTQIAVRKRNTMPTMYRKAEANAHTRNPQPQYPTRRPPGNVPYLVDNLWEWTRPADMPNRRHSIFASPTPELAMQAGGAVDGVVYRVELPPADSRVCQIVEADARYHPDVKSLPKLVNSLLGHDWMDLLLKEKQSIAALWAPCLSADEVEEVFRNSKLAPLRRTVWESVDFWRRAQRVAVEERLPYVEGEIFFESGQYHLRSVDHPTV